MAAALLGYMAPKRFLKTLDGRVRGVVVGHTVLVVQSVPAAPIIRIISSAWSNLNE